MLTMNATYNSSTNSIQQKQKLRRTKKGDATATFRHQFNLAEALMKEMVASIGCFKKLFDV